MEVEKDQEAIKVEEVALQLRKLVKVDVSKEFKVEKCGEHSKLISSITEIKTDVKWLIKDRENQMKRYDNKKAFVRKVWLYGSGLFISFISYAFHEQEAIKASLKHWLNC